MLLQETYIEQSEHGGPTAGRRLSQFRELVEVVFAQNGIDGEFGSERVEIAGATDEHLWSYKDLDHFSEGGFDHHLAASGLDHGLFRHLRFVVGELGRAPFTRDNRLLAPWLFLGRRRSARTARSTFFGQNASWGIHNRLLHSVAGKILLRGAVSF